MAAVAAKGGLLEHQQKGAGVGEGRGNSRRYDFMINIMMECYVAELGFDVATSRSVVR